MHQAWSRHRGHGSQQSKTLLSSRGYLLKLGDRRMEEGTSGVNYAVCRRTNRVRGSGAGVYPTGSGGSEESSTARPGKGESQFPDTWHRLEPRRGWGCRAALGIRREEAKTLLTISQCTEELPTAENCSSPKHQQCGGQETLGREGERQEMAGEVNAGQVVFGTREADSEILMKSL